MATKVQQKSDKITPFGGINFVMDKFDAYLGTEIDSFLGLRSTTVGYQYSEIILAIVCVFLCGGSAMEDLNTPEGVPCRPSPYPRPERGHRSSRHQRACHCEHQPHG